MSQPSHSPVKTPCIGVCSTGIGDSVCRGCKRFTHEVINWNSYNQQQKRIVDQRLSGFLSQCVSNKLSVCDSKLLRWQLQVQQIPHVPSHGDYCGVFSLLKAGARQIQSPASFGFEVNSDFKPIALEQLRNTIDEEFFALSQAHYDRYILMPDLFGEPDK